ncbi:MAG: AI-2E family transporter [Gemmatimonadota bacterium]|nr:AI-2E family transporter [Gemmatimonadota bacterium]
MSEAKHGKGSGSEERPEERERPDLHKLTRLLAASNQPVDVRSIVLTGIFVLLLFYTLYFAKPFFLPITLAILLNFLLSPLVRALNRLRIPEGLGAAIVILTLLSAVVFGVTRLAGPASEWIDKVPQGLRRVERQIRDIQRPVEEVRRAAEQVEQEVGRLAGQDARRTQEVQVQDGGITGAILSRTQAFLAGAVVMLVLLYFLLASGDLFLRKLVRVLPRLEDKKRAIEIARKTEGRISTYLSTLTLINVGLGVVVAVAMKLAGLPNPVLWGVVAGVLNYIPYLGPIVTFGVIALVSVMTFDELGRALVAPLVYAGINFTEGSFVTPTLLGRRLTLNPVVVFVGLIFWGWLWGIPGALLAVPILATFKIFCDHIDPLSPVGEFLGR